MKLKNEYEDEKLDFVLGDDYSFLIALHERIIAKQLLQYEQDQLRLEHIRKQRGIYKRRAREKRKALKLKNKNKTEWRDKFKEQSIINRILSKDTQERIKELMIKEITNQVIEDIKKTENCEVLKLHEFLIQEKLRQDEKFRPSEVVRHKIYRHRHRQKFCCECGIEVEGNVRKEKCLKCYRKMSGVKSYVNPVKILSTGTDTEKVIRQIKINLLEGLTGNQVAVIKWFVKKGYHPLGFSVYKNEDEIYYMGENIAK